MIARMMIGGRTRFGPHVAPPTRSPPRTQPTPRRATTAGTTAKCALQSLFVRLTPKTSLKRHNLPMETHGAHLPGTGARHTAGASRRPTRSSLDACAARVLAPGGGGSFVRFFSFFFIEISRSFAGDGRMGVPCKRRQNEANGRAEPPSCAVAVEKCRNPLAAKNNGQAETQREKKFSSSASPSSFCARAMYPTQSNPPSQSLPHEHHTRRPQ
jgi:hypothetical protein